MASQKIHTASVLDGTLTTYWDSDVHGGVGPLVWSIKPTVAMDLFLTGGYVASDEAIPVEAGETYLYYDPTNRLTKIEGNRTTGAAGTVTIKPASGV